LQPKTEKTVNHWRSIPVKARGVEGEIYFINVLKKGEIKMKKFIFIMVAVIGLGFSANAQTANQKENADNDNSVVYAMNSTGVDCGCQVTISEQQTVAIVYTTNCRGESYRRIKVSCYLYNTDVNGNERSRTSTSTQYFDLPIDLRYTNKIGQAGGEWGHIRLVDWSYVDDCF